MNQRVISFKKYTDIESMKAFILQRLKLSDHKKDSNYEFYDRLKNYIDRSENLKIIIQFDREKIENDLRFKVKLENTDQEPYPDNFEMGNPLNRWLYDPIIRTEGEARQEEMKINKILKDRLLTFNNFLERLQEIGKGKVLIKDS